MRIHRPLRAGGRRRYVRLAAALGVMPTLLLFLAVGSARAAGPLDLLSPSATPEKSVLDEVTDPLVDPSEPAVEVLEPMTTVIDPATGLVEPIAVIEAGGSVSEELQPVTDAVQDDAVQDPVTRAIPALETEVIEPVTDAIREPLTEAIEPVSQKLQSVTEAVLTPVTHVLDPVSEVIAPLRDIVEPDFGVVDPVMEIVDPNVTLPKPVLEPPDTRVQGPSFNQPPPVDPAIDPSAVDGQDGDDIPASALPRADHTAISNVGTRPEAGDARVASGRRNTVDRSAGMTRIPALGFTLGAPPQLLPGSASSPHLGAGSLLFAAGWLALLISVIPPPWARRLLRAGSIGRRPQHFVEPLEPPG